MVSVVCFTCILSLSVVQLLFSWLNLFSSWFHGLSGLKLIIFGAHRYVHVWSVAGGSRSACWHIACWCLHAGTSACWHICMLARLYAGWLVTCCKSDLGGNVFFKSTCSPRQAWPTMGANGFLRKLKIAGIIMTTSPSWSGLIYKKCGSSTK